MAHTLTTPIAFINRMPLDCYSSKKPAAFGYWNADNQFWIVWSYGLDQDEKTGGQIEQYLRQKMKEGSLYNFDPKSPERNMLFDPNGDNPTTFLLSITYDSSNGSKSAGDMWRIRE